MQHTDSKSLFQEAQKVMPGGVNSPVRAFKAVGGAPIFFTHGQGAYIFDVDNNSYLDYVCSWGPLILGHAHPKVVEAVQVQASQGLSFGAPTPVELDLAKMVVECVPSIDLVRMVSSGTEATMSAIRLARGFTGRDKILKFNGCFHGSHDNLLVSAGSGILTLALPGTAGVPEATAQNVLVAEYNDINAVKEVFKVYGMEIAAVIVEPVAGNMNLILPEADFLSGLRKICDEYETLLIFDEVITGLRLGLGGAQQLFNVVPDLTTLGKILGGGMPVGAYGGKREIMAHIAPAGNVYQGGTLSGNPVSMAAGLATLTQLQQEEIYQNIEGHTKALCQGIRAIAKQY